VADIAGHLNTKGTAIAGYQSQFPPKKAHVQASADELPLSDIHSL
jgi:hypothetical protein